jgi:N-acyl-D-amino-acid deacylase
MHDVIIKGGAIVDGTGRPKFSGDVAFTSGRITGVGGDLGGAIEPLECRLASIIASVTRAACYDWP